MNKAFVAYLALSILGLITYLIIGYYIDKKICTWLDKKKAREKNNDSKTNPSQTS